MSEIHTERIAQDLRVLIRDTEDLLSATTDQAGEKAREVRQRLQAALANARESCRSMESKALDKAREAAREADQAIRTHPYQSIGVALGVGVLVGLLLNRQR
ncbi:MAG: YqjD family protein [Verrucomicrobiota bacterium]